jgi:outer membrane protein TolC
MKKISLFLMLLSTFFAALAQESQAQDTLRVTLAEAVSIALSESPTIKVAEKEIQRVRYAKKETLGGLLPTVSLSGAYQRAVKKQVMYMDGDAFNMEGMLTPMLEPMMTGLATNFANAGVDPVTFFANMQKAQDDYAVAHPAVAASDGGITIGRDNTFNGGLSASLPLIAPALWSSINLSEAQLELAQESARASKISLVNQVSKAYYSVLMAQDSYAVIKRSADNSIENARIVKSKYEKGSVSEFEWIRADVQARNAMTNVVSAESAVTLTILQLKMLMGIDMFIEVKATGSLSDYEASMYGDVMQIDTTTLSTNTDLKQFDIQTKQLKESLKINQATMLPTLGLQFDYSYASMVQDDDVFTDRQKWNPTSNVSLGLQIPLFQGGTKINKNRQIKVQLDEMQLNRLNLERSLQLQVINYFENIKKSLKKIESDKQAMLQAEKAVSIAMKMYEVGVATYLDVSNSELSYISSGLTYNQSIFDYLSNKSDLEKVLGNKFSENR